MTESHAAAKPESKVPAHVLEEGNAPHATEENTTVAKDGTVTVVTGGSTTTVRK